MNKVFLHLPLLVILLLFLSSCQYFHTEDNKGKTEEQSAKEQLVKKNYRTDNSLYSAIEYKDNMRHGVARSYHKDGKTIYNEISYKFGIKNGLTNSYYKNGKLYYSINYIDGKRQGVMKKYYRTGELMAEIPFKDSQVQEGLKEFQKSGKLKVIYPHIVFEKIDNTAFEHTYIVRVKLSNAKKNVKFYRILIDEDGTEIIQNLLLNNGIADVRFDVRGKRPINVNLKIKAEFTTFLRNTYIIYKEMDII